MRMKNDALRRPLRILALLVSVTALFSVLYAVLMGVFLRQASEAAPIKAQAIAESIELALARLDHLPFVLSQDPKLATALSTLNGDDLNPTLAEAARRSNAEVIYVMSPAGETIAASNYDQVGSFVGRSYFFRPYFQTALNGNVGHFFAVGATTGRPGYFVAEPVRNQQGTISGVVVIKLGLNSLTDAWADTEEEVWVTTAEGIVLTAKTPAHRYRTLAPLSAATRSIVDEQRQFADAPLEPLDWKAENGRVALNGQTYLATTASLSRDNWTLHLLTDLRGIRAKVFWYIGVAFVAILLLGGIAMSYRSSQLRSALHHSNADRERLSIEIEERRLAQSQLQDAQTELARNSRLAALGQLSASITHELGQPISAMQNYLTAAEIQSGAAPGGVNANLSGLVARMQNITEQLRFFATPARREPEIVSLQDVVAEASKLMEHTLKDANVPLTVTAPDQPIRFKGVQHRMEQVVVNLLRNALHATQDMPSPKIHIGISAADNKAILSVTDNGYGLKEKSISDLSEPFMTTKSSGEGMGLGLAISAQIIKDHDGAIAAKNGNDCGAQFDVTLPLVTKL
jgi:two-component system, NtrC family, C4-dicarboxylate transport sensor histidine kinase DctB